MDEHNFKRDLCKLLFNSRRVVSCKKIFARIRELLAIERREKGDE